MAGRASKQKGSRNERGLVKLLIEAGFAAERSPLSGALRSERFGSARPTAFEIIREMLNHE